MPSNSLISVIICTRNRASGVRNTLESLNRCRIPSGCRLEVLVINNASADNTESLVRGMALGNALLRHIPEPHIGLSRARNTGLAHAQGEIILFTDDDILVDENWVLELATPLLHRNFHAVTGSVSIAKDLIRPWMTRTHKGWLASSIDAQLPGGPVSLVGANMGFHRSVLDHVPAFDQELGAGAMGSGEDTLFGRQLIHAGFRIGFNASARVEHHLNPVRLLRRQWLEDAVKRGKTEGYLLYHWEHGTIRHLPLLEFSLTWRLKVRGSINPQRTMDVEGCPPWEMSYVSNIHRCRQFAIESNRPRLYGYHALKRLDWNPSHVSISLREPAYPITT